MVRTLRRAGAEWERTGQDLGSGKNRKGNQVEMGYNSNEISLLVTLLPQLVPLYTSTNHWGSSDMHD